MPEVEPRNSLFTAVYDNVNAAEAAYYRLAWGPVSYHDVTEFDNSDLTDPEFLRLLAEEEEIERTTRQRQEEPVPNTDYTDEMTRGLREAAAALVGTRRTYAIDLSIMDSDPRFVRVPNHQLSYRADNGRYQSVPAYWNETSCASTTSPESGGEVGWALRESLGPDVVDGTGPARLVLMRELSGYFIPFVDTGAEVPTVAYGYGFRSPDNYANLNITVWNGDRWMLCGYIGSSQTRLWLSDHARDDVPRGLVEKYLREMARNVDDHGLDPIGPAFGERVRQVLVDSDRTVTIGALALTVRDLLDDETREELDASEGYPTVEVNVYP